jgi:uncharacterized protein YegJ (DUF2314 family)
MGKGASMNVRRLRVFLSIAMLTAVFGGCSARASDDESAPNAATPIPAGELIDDVIAYEFAVYYMPRATKDPSAELDRLLAEDFATFQRAAEFVEDLKRPTIVPRYEKNVAERYAPPDLESLKYFGRGLDRKQALALQECREAYIVEFAYPKASRWTELKAALKLVERIARETGGLLWDETTREVFSPDAWKSRRIDVWNEEFPDVSTLTTIHAYRHDRFFRAVSLGAAKFGVPDVVVDDFPSSLHEHMGTTMMLVLQALAEGQTLSTPGHMDLNLREIKSKAAREAQLKALEANSTGIATLTLKVGEREEGDPPNRLIGLGFDRVEGPDEQARQMKALSALFGHTDSIAAVKQDDSLLVAASARARSKLPAMRSDFNKGLPPGELILLKVPFTTSDGSDEYMWVEVSKWEGDKILGLLQNDPIDVPNLKAGQNVETSESKVFDYIRRKPDGSVEGNETGEIIRKMQEERAKP